MKTLAAKQGAELKIPGLDTKYLHIIRNAATQRIYQLSEYAETFARMRPKMYGWDWLRDNLDRLIIPVRANSQFWIEEQIDDFKGAAFLYSDWERYDEEEGLTDPLKWFLARGLEKVPAPATGHAYFSAIRKLVENKKPRYIIPVNTEHRDKFTRTFGKRAKVLKNGEEFSPD